MASYTIHLTQVKDWLKKHGLLSNQQIDKRKYFDIIKMVTISYQAISFLFFLTKEIHIHSKGALICSFCVVMLYYTKGGNMKKNFKLWLKCAGVRALKTVAQTAIATIGTSAVISEVDWIMVLSASLLAGILSLLTSIAGIPEVEEHE